ncbi:2-aminoethylphosphonate--pyruvate transaminase [Salinibius halmophilus]|uniref:2-aminoethylphosphonate--pyruvate transaminase n=1 Tax=Salinibius halmophilus TaxID=1853216 RepID=UPI000E672185|nr:2-aminoethylphosphonate--pyruvate transaminase [Salinibius halmophilus]
MQQPILLTPGPITTTMATKEAMLWDYGSWDGDFNQVTADICHDIAHIANAEHTHQCILMQGSGTFMVEATLASLIGKQDKALVIMNGAYGQRMATILSYLGRQYVTLDMGDYLPPKPNEVAGILDDDPDITHVVIVHCETSSGIYNPVEAVFEVVQQAGRELIIDSMSGFGALPFNAQDMPVAAIISSANKCLESVPGFAFCLVRNDLIDSMQGNAHSLSLDLYAQHTCRLKTGQWRFTPPTHSVAAARHAIQQYLAEGGQPERLAKYQRNCQVLVEGMRQLGFKTLLEDQWLSPIIVTFLAPDNEQWQFTEFYNALKQHGFIIYPGKLTEVESFRIGCIGSQSVQDYYRLLDTIANVMALELA